MRRYDLIGDIHGHCEKLVLLLKKLGYVEIDGVFRHSERTAIFLGDFIDRGPHQVETVRVVRAMVEGGSALAVLGNHEANAISFATPDPDHPGEYLRKHNARNRHPHAEFLRQIGEGCQLYLDTIEWFKTLPVYLDLEVRAVHACWHPQYIKEIDQYLNDDKTVKAESWVAFSRRGTHAYEVSETILKGAEVDLPDGISYEDKDGIKRTRTRTRWWDQGARTYRQLGHVSDSLRALLPEDDVPASALVQPDDDRPIFIGHFWLRGIPEPLSQRIACLDYSIGKGCSTGKLCCYRWDGEQVLSKEKFVWVDGGYEVGTEE